MDFVPFKIENTFLGARLEGIKNNTVDVLTPLQFSANTILNTNQFIQVVTNGVVGNTTLASIVLTTPNAASILASIPLQVGQKVEFSVGSFCTPSNANTVTIVPGSGITSPSPVVVSSQTTRKVFMTCYSTVVPALVMTIL